MSTASGSEDFIHDQLLELASRPASELREIGGYRILREVGRGGMGIVYEAEQVSLGRRVALKVLPTAWAAGGTALERFRREARASARLHHTNIVPVFEVGRDGELVFYAMQFIEGQSLDAVIRDLARFSTGVQHRGTEPTLAPSGDLPGRTEPTRSTGELSKLAESLLHGRFLTPDTATPADGPAPFGLISPERFDGGTATGIGSELDPSGWRELRTDPDSGSVVPAVLPGGALISGGGSSGGRLPFFRSVAQIGRQVAQGLAHAHARGIVHRDVKPSNLLLDSAGVVWITDFGLAKADDDGLTQTGDIVGTIRYMAPERFRGEGDARADIYSLALTLYELLTLRPAFASAGRLEMIESINSESPVRPRTVDRHVPRDLETIVLKGLDKDPRRRYQSAGELAEELRRFIDGEPIQARRVGEVELLWKWARRRPLVATLGTTLIVLFAALLGLGAWSYLRINEALSAAKEDRQQALNLGGREAAARKSADRDRADAVVARNEALAETYHALLSETRALRLARETGWRHEALENLRRLATIPTPRKDVVKLRTEAAACLAEMDARRLLQISPRLKTVWNLAFSPDGRTLAIGGSGLLWDLEANAPTGQVLLASEIAPLAFHPGGGYLAFGAPGDRVVFHPMAGDAPVLPPLSGPGPAVALAFDRAGRTVAVAWGSTVPGSGIPLGVKLVDVFDLTTAKPLLSVGGPFDHPNYKVPLALSPDGLNLAAVGPGHTVQIYPVGRAGPPVVLGRHRSEVESLAFSPNGLYVASAGRAADVSVKLWDVVRAREHLSLPGHSTTVWGVAFSPDGGLLASIANDQTLRLWDVRTGHQRLVIPVAGSTGLSVAFSPRGDRVAAPGSEIFAFELLGFQERRMLLGHANTVQAVAFNPKRGQVASVGVEELIFWDASSGRPARSIRRTPGPSASTVVYSPDGRLLATPTMQTQAVNRQTDFVELWDTETLGPPRVLSGASGAIRAIAFDSSGRRIAAGMADGMTTVCDVASGAVVYRLPAGGPVGSLGVLERGSILLVATTEGRIFLHDIDRDRPIRETSLAGPTPSAAQYNYAVAPGEHRLAAGGSDGSLRLVTLPDLVVGEVTMNAHDGPITTLAFPRDGRLLSTAGSDHRVVLRDPATLHPLAELASETATVFSIAFHPDGASLAFGGTSEPVILWDIGLMRDAFERLGLGGAFPGADKHADSPGTGVGPGPADVARQTSHHAGALPSVIETLDSLPRDLGVWSERSRLCNTLTRDEPLFERVLALRPDEPLLWYAKGLEQARHRRYDLAAADFVRGGGFGASTEFSYELACLYLLAGDSLGYRQLVTRMIESDGTTSDPYRLFVLTRTAALAPTATSDQNQSVRWGERAVSALRAPWTLHALGMACYRAGRYRDGVRRFEESASAGNWSPAPVVNWFGLALAHHRLGELAAARRWLRQASALVDRAPPAHFDEPDGIMMTDWLEANVLRREAEALILFDPSFPADPFAR